ncbi:unnamed protein product [Plasmodium vivax]|uniref:(malaria parasite P. vivax) hypothetical protein n=1 Tax=Plasmodium vivax TaxID=5855 RepID=A0A8S4H9A1_PLAVI|nr:unnamed protein product [Plasmodium vivax]
MPCSKEFKGYHSYECYKKLKYQFVERIKESPYTITDEVKKIEEVYPPKELENLKKLPNVFTNLKKYLSNSGVFASSNYNGDVTCNYINYLLYYGIRKDKHGDPDETTFNDFRDFVNKYNEKTKSTMCLHKIKRLNFDVFRKWEALYHLYDKYMELSSANPPYYYKYCDSMNNLVYIYNNFLKVYPSDSLEFNDVLTKFEQLMNTITQTGKIHCEGENYTINKPSLFKETVKETPQLPNTLSRPESNPSQEGTLYSAVNSQYSEGTSLSTTSVGEQQRTYTENLQSSQVSDLSKVETNVVSQESVDRNQGHDNLKHSEQHESFGLQERYLSRRTYGPSGSYRPREYIETKETDPLGENSVVEKEQLGLRPEKENVGVMTNIQNALSGFMKDVDPVPVVGVSGGMGALFLLFRYTPVGAFFRGGRRINNRIPSRFSGQFLGGFPGYEEFYDGGFANGPINISYRPELE